MSPTPEPEYISTTTDVDGTDTLVFFIPGNPGCINYYRAFLAHLTEALPRNQRPSIVGISLANFGTQRTAKRPLGLQEQIEYAEQHLLRWVQKLQSANDRVKPVKVIIIGHSVGAYIGMEVLRRWKERKEALSTGARGQPPSGDSSQSEIIDFIGLWPTITRIAESQSGKRMSWILRLPRFAAAVSVLAALLGTFLPFTVLHWLVRGVTRFPQDAADVTASFISRPYSVWQALHMARDEMNEIIEDRWSSDIWHAGADGTRLAFLFGQEDHWVSADAREELLQNHGRTSERQGAIMEIDGTKIPHSFCIRDSQAVAERTAEFMRDQSRWK